LRTLVAEKEKDQAMRTMEMIEAYKNHWDRGVYSCTRCGQELFTSDDKFDSQSRRPSYRRALENAVLANPNYEEGAYRIDVMCSTCRLHLGQVFDDGELHGDSHPEAGLRYTVWSSALRFDKKASH